MAVTVNKVYIDKPFVWHKDKDGAYALMWSNRLRLDITRNGKKEHVEFSFKGRDAVPGNVGFRCNGLSVPWAFRWFLKSWDNKNQIYNLAGALRDWLYATSGANGVFTRSECDDFFRGLLRESGKSRFKASAADLMVGIFAGNSRHWGNDDYGVSSFVKMTENN